MPPDAELELRQASALVRQQGRIVERRKAFISSVEAGSQAHELHSDQLRGEQKILDDLKAIEADKEKIVLAARESTRREVFATEPTETLNEL